MCVGFFFYCLFLCFLLYYLFMYFFFFFFFFFFFQAEDGIRDDLVTGVQTCALPISSPLLCGHSRLIRRSLWWCNRVRRVSRAGRCRPRRGPRCRRGRKRMRSEERRVGKECRSRWSPDHEKKKKKK